MQEYFTVPNGHVPEKLYKSTSYQSNLTSPGIHFIISESIYLH